MLVSVIIPTFNRAAMAAKAVASALSQTHGDLEAIVVDDGSTDDTEAAMKKLAAEAGPRMKYFRKNNGGCASARNLGIEKASGDAISFLDSDDEFYPDAIEKLVAKLDASDADYVFSPIVYVDAEGGERFLPALGEGGPENVAVDDFLNPRVSITAALFCRRVFDKVGAMDENLRYNEDSDFFQRVAINCRGAYSDAPSVKVLKHADNKSNNRVEIYGALQRSAEKILAAHPEFENKLGVQAGDRIRTLENLQIEALIDRGDFERARDMMLSLGRPAGRALRMSAALRSAAPLTAQRFLKRIEIAVKIRLGGPA